MGWPKGVPRRRSLFDEDLAVIASAPPEMTVGELARQLGRPYFTVAAAVRRIRREGWITRVAVVACTECGEPVATRLGAGRRHTHPGCIPVRGVRHGRERRARRAPGSLSTPYVAEWREANPEADRMLRDKDKARRRAAFPDLPADERRAIAEKVHAADRRDYPLTLDQAEHSGEPWDAEEDRYILERLKTPARDIALELGRTLWAVRHRRSSLTRQARRAVAPRSATGSTQTP